ncbi:MAG TPA: HEAT repeat domain-containing protein [Tepidisphaeraceae bacterium]|jgi:HEAT repeat protein|nr:HEAT repeat domain-containing protein [Tepidisphaeraceae bacterium]
MRKDITVLIGIATAGLFIAAAPYFDLYKRRSVLDRLTEQRQKLTSDPHDRYAMNELIDSLKSHNSHERSTAAACLRQLGSVAEPAVPALIEVARSNDPYAARESVIALGEVGGPAASSLPTLIELIKTKPDSLGAYAADAIGKIADVSDDEARLVLEHATKGESSLLRDSATASLQKLQLKHRAGTLGPPTN